MSTTVKTRLWLTALLFASASTLPGLAAAQQVTRAPSQPTQASAQASALLQEAQRIEETSHDVREIRKAARLQIQAAQMLSADDPQAEARLRHAAIQLYEHRPVEARQAMIAAGDRALARGDVFAAAQTYVNVAWMIKNQKKTNEQERDAARAYLVRARLLATSPLVTSEERASIMERITVKSTPTRVAARP